MSKTISLDQRIPNFYREESCLQDERRHREDIEDRAARAAAKRTA